MAESLDLGGTRTNGKLTILDGDGNVAARIVTEPEGTEPLPGVPTATALGPGRKFPIPVGPTPIGGMTITGIVHAAGDRFEIGHAGRPGVIEVRSPSNVPVVSLLGASASVTMGAPNQSGTLSVVSTEGRAAFTVKSVDNYAIVEIGHPGRVGGLRLFNAAGQPAVALDGTTGQVFLYDSAGHPSVILDAASGDIVLGNADIAEEFDVSEDVTPGCVVTLAASGKLECTSVAYDTAVAGVVSGLGNYRPGLVLDRQRSRLRRLPVAMLGKVMCLVDATVAPVRRGDLLTSSTRPGHAMAVTEPNRALGAVIGKALSDLPSGCGAVPMLVGLR